MKRISSVARLIVASCCLAAAFSRAGAEPTCAIVPFQAGEGVASSVPRALEADYEALLRASGLYEVLPVRKSNALLARGGFDSAAYASRGERLAAAGELLGTDYLVYGVVEQQPTRYALKVSLAERGEDGMAAVRTVGTYATELSAFRRQAAASSLKTLLNLAEAPALPKPALAAADPIEREPAAPPPSFAAAGGHVDAGTGLRAKLAGRLEVGTRITRFTLDTERRDSFIGTVNRLDAEQDLAPLKVYANWLLSPSLSVELTWDRVEAAFLASEDQHRDGDIVLSGPIVTAFLRRPLDVSFGSHAGTVIPYGGVGVALYSGSFEHAGWWHHGFQQEPRSLAEAAHDEWVASGAPAWPNNGFRRTMNIDDAVGLVFAAGCSAAMTESVSLDVYVRHTSVEADDTFTLSTFGNVFETRKATIPLDNLAVGIGVKYSF